MACRSLFFTISQVVGAATGSYTMTDSQGVYVFNNIHHTLLNGVTFSVTDTETSFTLTNYRQTGTYSICNPYPYQDGATQLLLHADGTLSDYSIYGHGATLNGTAYISTTFSKFGSGNISFPASGDWVGATSSAAFDFSKSSFTMECFFKYSSPTGSNVLFSSGTYSATSNWWHVSVAPAGNAFFDRNYGVMVFSQYLQDDGTSGKQTFYETNAGTWSSAHSPNTWYHMALVRQYGDRTTSTMSFYIDGVAQFSGVINSATYSVGTYSFFPAWPFSNGFDKIAIGPRFGTGYNYTFAPGLSMDEVRISNVARWTSNFTPPSAPYLP